MAAANRFDRHPDPHGDDVAREPQRQTPRLRLLPCPLHQRCRSSADKWLLMHIFLHFYVITPKIYGVTAYSRYLGMVAGPVRIEIHARHHHHGSHAVQQERRHPTNRLRRMQSGGGESIVIGATRWNFLDHAPG